MKVSGSTVQRWTPPPQLWLGSWPNAVIARLSMTSTQFAWVSLSQPSTGSGPLNSSGPVLTNCTTRRWWRPSVSLVESSGSSRS